MVAGAAVTVSTLFVPFITAGHMKPEVHQGFFVYVGLIVFVLTVLACMIFCVSKQFLFREKLCFFFFIVLAMMDAMIAISKFDFLYGLGQTMIILIFYRMLHIQENIEKLAREKNAVESKEQEERFTLLALSGLFSSMTYIDIKNDDFHHIGYLREKIVNTVATYTDMCVQDKLWNLLEEIVYSPFKDEMKTFTDFRTLPDRLRGKKSISIEAINEQNQWNRYMFVRLGDDLYGKLDDVIFMSQNIDSEVREKERLQKDSMVDALTSVFNRNAFEKATKKMEKEGIPQDLFLLFVDLNGLKITNDSIGHKAGDELIVMASEIIRKAIGKDGNIYRVGGDEFIVLINSNDNDFKNIINEIEKLRSQWTGNFAQKLYFSKGWVKAADYETPSFETMMNDVDIQMYKDKQQFYKNHTEFDIRRSRI